MKTIGNLDTDSPDSVVQLREPKSAASASAAGPPLRLAYSVKEAALILGVSEKSVRRLIDRGLIRPSRALRHLLIPRKEIERFLEETSNTFPSMSQSN